MTTSATFLLSSPESLGRCVSMLSQAPLDGTVEVAIRAHKETRKDAQNRLYWAWLGQLSSLTGYRKEELHRRFGRSYLSMLYLEAPANKPQEDWCAAWETIQEFTQGLGALDRRKAEDRVLALISTTWATVEQFSDYLIQIEEFCFDKELPLGRTDDYERAMT